MPEWHSIQFVWPRLLWLLATLPLWLGLYIAWQRRGVQRAWPSASMNTRAANRRFTRHAPALLVLLGLSGMLVAIARPQAILLLPSRIDTVMLAIDHGYFLGPTKGLECPSTMCTPLVPGADTLMLTRGLYAIFAGIVRAKGIRLLRAEVATWRKYFLGHYEWSKQSPEQLLLLATP